MNYRIILCLLLIVAMVGTVSADTLLIYANNDGNTLQYSSGGSSWQTMRDGTGSSSSNNAAAQYATRLKAHSGGDKYTNLNRYGLTFNTSTVGSGSTISSTVLRMKYQGKVVTLGGTLELAITNVSPTDPLTYAAGDYNNLILSTSNEFATRFDYTSITTGNVNFTLNAAGLSYINKTGYTAFYTVDGDELDNSFSGTWGSGYERRLTVSGVGDSTQANRPYIEIVYSGGAPSAPVASFTINRNPTRIPNSITVTDTSTNTPTSWEWSWGDGTSNSTTQNPSHTYTKRGKFDIYLTATNAGGSGATATATSVKVVGYENYY